MYAPVNQTKLSQLTPVEVMVFRTNLRFKRDLEFVSPLLNDLPGLKRWTLDREDKDKVLRIEAQSLSPQLCIDLLTEAGYLCEEL